IHAFPSSRPITRMGGVDRGGGPGHRKRDPQRAPHPYLRTLLQSGPGAIPRRGGDRFGPRHRQTSHRVTRRHDRGAEPGRSRNHDPFRAAAPPGRASLSVTPLSYNPLSYNRSEGHLGHDLEAPSVLPAVLPLPDVVVDHESVQGGEVEADPRRDQRSSPGRIAGAVLDRRNAHPEQRLDTAHDRVDRLGSVGQPGMSTPERPFQEWIEIATADFGDQMDPGLEGAILQVDLESVAPFQLRDRPAEGGKVPATPSRPDSDVLHGTHGDPPGKLEAVFVRNLTAQGPSQDPRL